MQQKQANSNTWFYYLATICFVLVALVMVGTLCYKAADMLFYPNNTCDYPINQLP